MTGRDPSIFGLRRDVAVFASLAALYVIAEWIIGRMVGPFSADPDYIYLFNGMDILTLRAPAYYDHPGTPVQMIIAVVIGAIWVLTLAWHGLSNVKDEVLTHSEFYLEGISAFFVALNASALIFFAWRVRLASGRAAPAIVGILSLFISYPVLLTFHRVMPETILLGAVLALTGILAKSAFAKDAVETSRVAIAVGIVLGFCFTAKVTSAPLLLAIFFFRSSKAKRMAAFAFAISAVGFTLPIAQYYPAMARFYLQVFTHTGVYGTGGAGLPPLSEILANAQGLCSTMPEIYFCPLLYGMVLALHAWFGLAIPDNCARLLKLCVAIIGLSVLLVVKQPEVTHMLPGIVFLSLGNAVAVWCLLGNGKIATWAYAAIILLVSKSAFADMKSAVQPQYAQFQADEQLLARVSRSGCLIVPRYIINRVDFNLFFGNISSGSYSSGRLQRLYPRAIFLNGSYRKFQTFFGVLDADTAERRLAGEKCVYLAGEPIGATEDTGIARQALTFVDRSPSVTVYALSPDWNKAAAGGTPHQP